MSEREANGVVTHISVVSIFSRKCSFWHTVDGKRGSLARGTQVVSLKGLVAQRPLVANSYANC